jgi:sulfur carrier protein ThiS
VDFTIEQEKEKCNMLIKTLGAKIRIIRNFLETGEEPEKREAAQEELNRLLEEQRQISDKLAELLAKTVPNESAAVEVSGEVVPGTLIEICRIGFSVSEPLRRVRIKLERGIVFTEPL